MIFVHLVLVSSINIFIFFSVLDSRSTRTSLSGVRKMPYDEPIEVRLTNSLCRPIECRECSRMHLLSDGRDWDIGFG